MGEEQKQRLLRLSEHPILEKIAKYVNIQVYDRDGGTSSPRIRLELRTKGMDPALLEEVMAVQTPCVRCGDPVSPFRKRSSKKGGAGRVEGMPGHVYIAIACPLRKNYGCCRGAEADHEYVAIRERVCAILGVDPESYSTKRTTTGRTRSRKTTNEEKQTVVSVPFGQFKEQVCLPSEPEVPLVGSKAREENSEVHCAGPDPETSKISKDLYKLLTQWNACACWCEASKQFRLRLVTIVETILRLPSEANNTAVSLGSFAAEWAAGCKCECEYCDKLTKALPDVIARLQAYADKPKFANGINVSRMNCENCGEGNDVTQQCAKGLAWGVQEQPCYHWCNRSNPKDVPPHVDPSQQPAAEPVGVPLSAPPIPNVAYVSKHTAKCMREGRNFQSYILSRQVQDGDTAYDTPVYLSSVAAEPDKSKWCGGLVRCPTCGTLHNESGPEARKIRDAVKPATETAARYVGAALNQIVAKAGGLPVQVQEYHNRDPKFVVSIGNGGVGGQGTTAQEAVLDMAENMGIRVQYPADAPARSDATGPSHRRSQTERLIDHVDASRVLELVSDFLFDLPCDEDEIEHTIRDHADTLDQSYRIMARKVFKAQSVMQTWTAILRLNEEVMKDAPAPADGEKPWVACRFCGKGVDDVKKLIQAPDGTNICDVCVDLAWDLLHDKQPLQYSGEPESPCSPLGGASPDPAPGTPQSQPNAPRRVSYHVDFDGDPETSTGSLTLHAEGLDLQTLQELAAALRLGSS